MEQSHPVPPPPYSLEPPVEHQPPPYKLNSFNFRNFHNSHNSVNSHNSPVLSFVSPDPFTSNSPPFTGKRLKFPKRTTFFLILQFIIGLLFVIFLPISQNYGSSLQIMLYISNYAITFGVAFLITGIFGLRLEKEAKIKIKLNKTVNEWQVRFFKVLIMISFIVSQITLALCIMDAINVRYLSTLYNSFYYGSRSRNVAQAFDAVFGLRILIIGLSIIEIIATIDSIIRSITLGWHAQKTKNASSNSGVSTQQYQFDRLNTVSGNLANDDIFQNSLELDEYMCEGGD